MSRSPSRRDALRLMSMSVIAGAAPRAHASPAAEAMRYGGTGSAMALMTAIGEAYKAAGGGAGFVAMPALGSSGGIQATRDKAIDFAISARPLKADEAVALESIALARSPFVIATSHRDPEGVKAADIARMIADPQAKWHDGAPVRIILRPRNENDNALMAKFFPGTGAAIEAARKRPDIPIAVNDQDNAAMAEAIPGSLVGAALVQLQLEKRNLRALAIDGIVPLLAALDNGTYPYTRDIHLVFAKSPSAAVARFVAFLRSPDGTKLIRACGCQPIA